MVRAEHEAPVGQAALFGQSAEGMLAAPRATSIRRPPPLHPLPSATSTAAPGGFTPRCTLSAALLTCLFYAASCVSSCSGYPQVHSCF